jgi:predicted AlkP superfamily pyrophosphatase or phosphodiesterase
MLALTAFVALTQAAAPAPADAPPVRLVVMIAIDQMIPDHLDRLAPWLHGGFARFVEQGTVFERAALQHGDTETGPGHTCYGTGLNPTHNGIVSNEWLGIDAKHHTYCVSDDNAHSVTSSGVGKDGYFSPRNIRAGGLVDFVKSANPKSKSLAISSKDRAAIGMSGQHPDLVLWWDHGGRGYATSTWYVQALPQWVLDWNAHWTRELLDGPFGKGWNCDFPEHFEASGTAPDERDGELGKPGQRSFPHALPAHADPPTDKELSRLAEAVYDGPAGDQFVCEMAGRAVEQMQLGTDDDVDVLALSLSSCDLVGHAYGPLSCEVTDVLLRADRELGQLFDLLDAKVGRDRWIASLSADHGVLELPESLAARGVASERISGRVVGDAIKAARAKVAEKFGKDFYLASDQRGVRLSLTGMLEARVEPADVRRAYADAMKVSGAAWLQHVLTFDELKAIARDGAPASGLVRMEANSFDEERTCDLVMLQKPWLLIGVTFGSTHGTPYPYDRNIPLAFYGPGFPHASDYRDAASIDIVPTLLHRLHIAAPTPLDGHVLVE